ncbi:hypothetical protein BD311DRAFT_386982 [Dichomitus squalens]|uniref:Uncharacterized protein n=1 Tax=Dichomitus squalens TaxID=114155 RepID=A0A4Q9MMN0_9APHY|nr:hypothetical protein BD311DRAFT_386982 [Dichomitus squalens]
MTSDTGPQDTLSNRVFIPFYAFLFYLRLDSRYMTRRVRSRRRSRLDIDACDTAVFRNRSWWGRCQAMRLRMGYITIPGSLRLLLLGALKLKVVLLLLLNCKWEIDSQTQRVINLEDVRMCSVTLVRICKMYGMLTTLEMYAIPVTEW